MRSSAVLELLTFVQRAAKKRVVRDDEDDELGGPRRKQLYVDTILSRAWLMIVVLQ